MTRRRKWLDKLPRYGGVELDTRPQAVLLVVLGLLALGLLFLWLAGTDLFDGRWERVDLANAILFAAAVMAILSALMILVGWFFERAERRQ